MIKWLMVVIFVIPRIIYSEIVLLIMNHNKEKYNLQRRYKVVRNTVLWINKFLRVDLNVTNKEIIKQQHSNGRIYVSNHLNLYDAISFIVLSERPLIFISKKENKTVPFLSTHLKAIETLCIDRESPRQSLKVCKQAGILVKEGQDIVIFPEGTRSKDGNVVEFKAALKTIIHYSESETVLVCMNNTNKALSWHWIKYPKEKIDVMFFKPLSYNFYLENKKDYNEILRNTLQQQLEKFRGKEE